MPTKRPSKSSRGTHEFTKKAVSGSVGQPRSFGRFAKKARPGEASRGDSSLRQDRHWRPPPSSNQALATMPARNGKRFTPEECNILEGLVRKCLVERRQKGEPVWLTGERFIYEKVLLSGVGNQSKRKLNKKERQLVEERSFSSLCSWIAKRRWEWSKLLSTLAGGANSVTRVTRRPKGLMNYHAETAAEWDSEEGEEEGELEHGGEEEEAESDKNEEEEEEVPQEEEEEEVVVGEDSEGGNDVSHVTRGRHSIDRLPHKPSSSSSGGKLHGEVAGVVGPEKRRSERSRQPVGSKDSIFSTKFNTWN